MEGHLGPAQMRTRELRLSRLGGVAVATAASRTSNPYKLIPSSQPHNSHGKEFQTPELRVLGPENNRQYA